MSPVIQNCPLSSRQKSRQPPGFAGSFCETGHVNGKCLLPELECCMIPLRDAVQSSSLVSEYAANASNGPSPAGSKTVSNRPSSSLISKLPPSQIVLSAEI